MYTRSIYTILDLLGDVGGLFDGLFRIGSILIYIYGLIFGDPLRSNLLKNIFKKGKLLSTENFSRQTSIVNIKEREPIIMRANICKLLKDKKQKRLQDRGLD